MTFTPSITVYETQYKCTIRPDEFNYSLNPTLLSGSEFTNPIISNGAKVNVSGEVVDFVTGSSFSPYITSVGLYNSNNEFQFEFGKKGNQNGKFNFPNDFDFNSQNQKKD